MNQKISVMQTELKRSANQLPHPGWLKEDLFPFESRVIQIDGNHIHYIDEGEGPLILFSHPAISWSFMYRDFIKTLRSKYRCIALDYPGFGLSGAGPDYAYTLESQSRILEQFVRRLQLRDIFLFGQDTGGPSAFAVAGRYPQWFSGLIISDTVLFPLSEYPGIRRMLRLVRSLPLTWLQHRFNLMTRLTFNIGIRTRRLSKAEKSVYFSSFGTRSRRENVLRILYSFINSEELMQELKQSLNTKLGDFPALLLYGGKDPVRRYGIVERTQDLFDDHELHWIPGEGHFPQEGQPERMATIIDNWITQVLDR
jgi:haloalkane dehalogenase